MTLDDLWNIYRDGGYNAVRELPATPPDAGTQFYRALLAFGAAHFAEAAQWARTAADMQPNSRVYTQAARYLDRVLERGKSGVYVDGEAFAAFIRGGGNVRLYAAVSVALRTVYRAYETLRLLDIGVGDGLALLPALTDSVAHVDLLEPSEAMLTRTAAQLDARGLTHTDYNHSLQAFMQTDTGQRDHWPLIQATWSLQSIPPEERPDVFAWLRARADRVLIAEFDVPAFDAMFAPDRVRYVLGRYEHGLAEYDGDGGQVAQGFLMPVMFGYFDRSAARTNWEGPIQDWVDGLRAAGFAQVATRKLYAYFWADSYLVDAQG